MRQKAGTPKPSADTVIKDIRRATRKQYGAEEKIRIVLEGLRGEESISALCRRQGIAESLYYSWSKEFLEASEKLEIIGIVERSHLPVRRTLKQLAIARATFYRWYDLFQTGGPEALEDRKPRPGRVWNRIPAEVRGRLIDLALNEPELSPRELA